MAVEARVYGRYLPTERDLDQKTTTWQQEVDLKLMKSLRGAHVRNPEEDTSQRNAYANLLERAYVVTDHLRLWNGTSSTPTKD